MSKVWMETVAEAQRRAKKYLPSSVYSALLAGNEKGVTYNDNMDAFSELGFAPRVAGLKSERDVAVSVMGQDLSMPVFISPAGVQGVIPDGEVAVARAAAARGTAMGLSSFASKPVEEVAEANPQTFFQLYWLGTRERILERMERARAAGVKGIILTLDWTFSYGRDWGSPKIPEKFNWVAMARMAPEVINKPKWLLNFAKSGAFPDLTVPNLGEPGQPAPTFFQAYAEWMQTAPPTWEDVAWLREKWGGPFMLKGITRIDDAKEAVKAGVSAISVSNHGGNNLDTTPASIRLLPAIVEAVGKDVEVILDGGIRRGSDVAKALALGAHAVMIGRAYLWGLSATGEAGVENVFDILRRGLESTMLGLGRASVKDLSPTDLIVPNNFFRSL